ncbi:MAG TPA: hypothetical protein VMT30_02985 [Candidatus Saccharimonadia bacterium]|nr:hypothetical protein [Candidatus Saccharimonadia bacterium]
MTDDGVEHETVMGIRKTRHSGLATGISHLCMICGALIILCGAANYAIAADAKRVMLLHSFGPQF